MKNRFLIAFAALSLLAVGCKDDNVGNPGEVLANTGDIYSIVLTSATMDAAVYGDGIIDRGVCWSEANAPTLEDDSVSDGRGGAGAFTVTLTNLKPGTRYYVRSYASFGDNTTYGSTRNFTTKPPLVVKSRTIPEDTSIVIKTNITGGDDAQQITERGVCYGASANPTVDGSKLVAASGGKGEFTLALTGLNPVTTYHVRSYAISEYGIEYGEDIEVKTFAVNSPLIFWEWLKESSTGNTYGVVRDAATKFVMHYTLNVVNSTVTITYIESTGNKDAKHVTKTLINSDATEFSWDPVTDGVNTFSGITRSGSAFSMVGTAGLSISAPLSATDIYSIFTHKNYGGISRCSELDHPGNEHASISVIWTDASLLDYLEYNGDRSAITAKGGNYRGYMMHMNTYQNEKPYIPIIQDVAFFSFDGKYDKAPGHAMKDDTAIAETEANLQPFYDLWENTKGVIIIPETTGKTPNEGGFNYYAIHPEDVTWVKWRLRPSGS